MPLSPSIDFPETIFDGMKFESAPCNLADVNVISGLPDAPAVRYAPDKIEVTRLPPL
ncbi:hypothetical protein D3C71_1894620 [compost metagenome]